MNDYQIKIKSDAAQLKIRRSEAFDAIKAVIDDGGFNESLSKELSTIYAYFLPNVSKAKAKTNELWVSRAVAKDDVRKYLNYAYAHDGKLWGCCGQRMHWIESSMSDGYYQPATFDVVNCDLKYPNIERVIPNDQRPNTKLKLSDLKIELSADNKLKYVYMPCGTVFNLSYMSDAFNCDAEMLYDPNADISDRLLLTSLDGIRHAVIMPMRK